MLKFSENFEYFRENFYFERIRMVQMVRMVGSLADRTFQLCRRRGTRIPERPDHAELRERRGHGLEVGHDVGAVQAAEEELEGLLLDPVLVTWGETPLPFSRPCKYASIRKVKLDI